MKGVSVIICCYNSEHRIDKTLNHLQAQIISSSLQWEIILVDNASNDSTVKKADELWNKNAVTEMNIISEPKPGLKNARLAGINKSKYEYISFIDDDNWVCK